MIKIIGFDLDQTLYPKSLEIDKAIQLNIYKKISKVKKYGIDKAEVLFKNLYQKNASGSRTIMQLLKTSEEKARNIVQRAMEKADIDKFLIPDSETILLLKDLQDKYIALDLITGSSKKDAFKKLKKLELENIFDHYITGEQASKSNGNAYKKWMRIYKNLDSSNFLYIGDEKYRDYFAPSKLGIKVILVNVKTIDNSINCLQLPDISKIRKYLL